MRLHTPRISGSLAVSSSVLTIDTLGSVSGSATSTGSFGRTEIGGELSVDAMSIPVLSTMSSSVATRFDSRETDMTLATASIALNESNMTLATASIAAITASISRLDDTESNMTLATASIAAITASVSTINDNMTLATASIAAITASVSTLKSNVGQELNTDSDVQFADITSTGTITAVEVHTTFVSSSIAVSSGSNNFGDASGDHHSFTGSLSISGSSSDTSLISYGKVGINTASPAKLLHVNAADGEQDNTSVAKFVNLESTSGRSKGVDIQAGTSTDDYMLSMDDQSGTTKFRFTGAGELGIGTTAPDGPLHVFVSDVGVTAAADGDDIIIENNVSSADVGMSILSKNTRSGLIFFGDGDSATVGRIQYTHAGNYMRFDAAGSEIMRISGSGEVGIGTTTPLTALHVHGATGNPASSGTTPTAIARFGTAGLNSVLDIGQHASPYAMWLQSHDRSNLSQYYNLVLQPDGGNVGIGTNNPDRLFHVQGSGLGNALGIIEDTVGNANFLLKATAANKNSLLLFGDAASDEIGTIDYDHADNSMRFVTNAGERLRILSGGGVTFNGDTATANALDDYEEGTYTVALTCGTSGTITLLGSKDTLMYTKIGRLVHVHGEISVSSVSSPSGTLLISLPFNVGDTTDLSERFVGSFSPQHITFPSNTVSAHINSYANQSTARVQLTIDGTTWAYLDSNTISASTEIVFGFSYMV